MSFVGDASKMGVLVHTKTTSYITMSYNNRIIALASYFADKQETGINLCGFNLLFKDI